MVAPTEHAPDLIERVAELGADPVARDVSRLRLPAAPIEADQRLDREPVLGGRLLKDLVRLGRRLDRRPIRTRPPARLVARDAGAERDDLREELASIDAQLIAGAAVDAGSRHLGAHAAMV